MGLNICRNRRRKAKFGSIFFCLRGTPAQAVDGVRNNPQQSSDPVKFNLLPVRDPEILGVKVGDLYDFAPENLKTRSPTGFTMG